jgi:hypothetical protein
MSGNYLSSNNIERPANGLCIGKTVWRDGRVVMQRIANPCTSVRFRLAPPNQI